ncbi:MAG: Ser-Thr-rich GPI-anchored membrane family protein, partial [Promethearchaeota archaeon]
LGTNVTVTWTTSGSSSASTVIRMSQGIEHVRQLVRMNRMKHIGPQTLAREIVGQSREKRDDASGRERRRSEESPIYSSSASNKRISNSTLSAPNNPRSESVDKLNVSSFHQKLQFTGKNRLYTVSSVKIELHQTGLGWRWTIAENTSNTGSFSWSVPNSLTPGTGYFVRISSVSDPSVTGDSEEFSIVSGTTIYDNNR